MAFRPYKSQRWFLRFLLSALVCVAGSTTVTAQNTVTGAFEGTVKDTAGAPIPGALVRFTYQVNGVQSAKITDQNGYYYQGLLAPGAYTIDVSAKGFKSASLTRSIFATRINQIVPVPVRLEPESPSAPPPVTPANPAQPAPTPGPTTQAGTGADSGGEEAGAGINATNATRGGAFTEEEVSSLPLGATTLIRTFDELALYLPGVYEPPQTQGLVAGPGVGPGVGSAGQFSVNGLRSRANNFTVDGSDNNDEDIGVRRQGFLSLIPQPVESIQEFQVITLLAPAQYGRNIGAQVNAISKSGGNRTHGTLYSFLNASQLNARDFFDTTNGDGVSALTAGGNQPVFLDGNPVSVRNESGGKDSLTLAQGGFVLGGPIKRDRLFYFVSGEGQFLNATKEVSFAVPTVEERGILNSGATGLYRTPFSSRTGAPAGQPTSAYPNAATGDAIFSLFPFPNNPRGIYGPNTLTQVLPASGRGKVFSGKFDGVFRPWNRQQSATGRYNLTDDWRDIPATGGALFSTLRPRIRTQNFSFFLNSEVTAPSSTSPVFNQLRLSYGRTRLNFEEVRNRSFLIQSSFRDSTFGDFGLLNARYIRNLTLPAGPGAPNTGPVLYASSDLSTEDVLRGPVGQVVVAGFSPIGIDVFNFPQRRVNNTYQVADTLTLRIGGHNFAFGTDIRRTELNSDLPRNARPLLTFNGAPQFTYNAATGAFSSTGGFIRPVDLAAGGAASGFSQSLVLPGLDSHINLRYYQLNFFGQDEWRVRPNLTLSYGLRYEYNTPAREINERIEETLEAEALNLVPGLRDFVGGRTRIYEPDRNNFAPRLGLAYSPNLFGRDRATMFRVGYGLFYDQIPGAVVSQSRNVFPNFVTINTPGGSVNTDFLSGVRPFPFGLFSILNPVAEQVPGHFHVEPGTLNVLANPESFTNLLDLLHHHIEAADFVASGGGFLPSVSGIGVTLPATRLEMPLAHHYSFTFEQQLKRGLVISVAYVGTQGRDLLRFTTPNLGPNALVAPLAFAVFNQANPRPALLGLALPPGTRIANGHLTGGRPVTTVGTVNIFETTASSRYDALQVQARGRLSRSLHFQAAYVLSKATDDVSDVFDLAGAPALPQNSLTLAGERGPANFDARHRFSYNLIYNLPAFNNRSRAFRTLFGGLQLASTGRFQTGQPFTVNSIFDVNLDGNLTDRLDSVSGIELTGDRQRPLRLTADPATLVAPIGQDGSVGRNTFRAGNLLDLDLSVIKNFKFSDEQTLILRVDIFNFINRANFGVPVRFLEAPGFGEATSTITPGRRIQFALKYSF